MAKYKYSVKLIELKEVHEIPLVWTEEEFRRLLHFVEYEDVQGIPNEELKDMACLALTDFEVEEAAVKVLEFRIGDRLNKGQRQNLAIELQEEKIWEEYADLSLHEELFHVSCMLFWAFPKNFREPDIARLKLTLSSLTQESRKNVAEPTAGFLTRVLNDGMDEHTLINRLFDESLLANSFPEAEHIIWQFEAHGTKENSNENTITIYTSWNWVEDLKGISEWESAAFADGQLE
ncbi:hypothetical protein [uncultured Muriicola sp.]|uniref:hypothetical protein n=1 Tax=uncultured Muriicola sp. TaxID=1583102 RepID=UPI002614EEFB|nr:hypothetical protein [uncultured Muriicola sp.]